MNEFEKRSLELLAGSFGEALEAAAESLEFGVWSKGRELVCLVGRGNSSRLCLEEEIGSYIKI